MKDRQYINSIKLVILIYKWKFKFELLSNYQKSYLYSLYNQTIFNK